MFTNLKNRLSTTVLAALLVVVVVVLLLSQPARAQREGATAFPRFSVIETEAHNLVVTDNQTNTVYFYTIDKDKEIGSDLKLRGSIDLKDVGKAVLTPSKANGK